MLLVAENLVLSRGGRTVIDGLSMRLGDGEVLLLTGANGTGKTTLCRMLLRLSDARTKFALILNPTFSESDLLRLIIEDLGMSSINKSKFDLLAVN